MRGCYGFQKGGGGGWACVIEKTGEGGGRLRVWLNRMGKSRGEGLRLL